MKNSFKIFTLFIFSIFLFIQCGKDEDPLPTIDPTVINITQSSTGPFIVGETLMLKIELKSDPSVGLSNFQMTRGSESLLDRDMFSSTLSNINYDYQISDADFYDAPISLTLQLRDSAGNMVTKSIDIEVNVDYPFFVESFDPDLYWSFVYNKSVSTIDSADLSVEIPPFSNAVFTALNGTDFYNVPDVSEIDYFNLNMTQEDILNAIDGISPVNTTGFQGSIPFVIDIKGTGEYTVLNFSSITGASLGYRKTSEFSGE